MARGLTDFVLFAKSGRGEGAVICTRESAAQLQPTPWLFLAYCAQLIAVCQSPQIQESAPCSAPNAAHQTEITPTSVARAAGSCLMMARPYQRSRRKHSGRSTCERTNSRDGPPSR